jgi:hypothetical protein
MTIRGHLYFKSTDKTPNNNGFTAYSVLVLVLKYIKDKP